MNSASKGCLIIKGSLHLVFKRQDRSRAIFSSTITVEALVVEQV